jgi:integrase/recombinase XerD
VKTVEVLKEVLAGKRLSKASRDNYEDAFKSLGEMYEEFPARSVEVNKWLASLGGYADTTVRLWFTLLREACKYMEDNYGLPNPCKGLELPRVRKKRRRYFRPEEIFRILQACRNEYELALITTLVDSTCRIGELAGLRVKDVGDGWIDVKGKTGEKRYRLDGRICEVLRRLGDGGNGTIFRLSSNCLSTKVIRICRRAGITGSKLGPHTLRHSSASLVASETKNVMAVKALLQHDDVQTSMIYIHDVEEELQKGISPLQLVGDRLKDRAGYVPKQLPMVGTPDNGEGIVEGEAAEAEGEMVEVVDALVGEMFPAVSDGVSVRPLLKSEDLELIREGFITMAMSGCHDGQVGKARELMKRMLRRVR